MPSTEERTFRSYRAGAQAARQRISRDRPLDAEALEAVEASDVVVVRGEYDRVEQVLDALEMPYTLIDGHGLASVNLNPDQLLIVNCPGGGLERRAAQIREFVEAGGSLFTTDWALKHVIEPSFPRLVSYNGHATADDVVRIEIHDTDNPFLTGVMDEGDDPQWWLEASSYPIRIHDSERVKVLLSSRELGDKYGESPVAVLFGVGEGEVFHMISHYYLQRTELRSERHMSAASEWAVAKGADIAVGDLDDLTFGEIETAHSSARFMANVVAAKKRKSRGDIR